MRGLRSLCLRASMVVTMALCCSLTACEDGALEPTASEDVTTDPGTPADASADVASDAAVDTTLPEPDVAVDIVEPDAATEPGGFGWPCTDNDDCMTGYCITTGNKKICTKTCDSSCPEDFVCAPVTTTGPDVAYICLPRFDKLCQPCREHKDCQPLFGAGTDICLDYGADGGFCGAECEEGTCPGGYTCSDEVAGDGVTVKQCRRVAGGASCPCSSLSQHLALSTDCSITNEFGTCSGERTCTELGLSTCVGATPKFDVCDGFDNDCDGIVDNAPPAACEITNQFGTCPGETLCLNGLQSCEGPQPALESCDGDDNDCNGSVDEGYPDTDGDGQADCIDPDDDGDGALDELDNCPLNANADQANADGDQQGDLCDLDDDNDGTPDTTDCDPLNPLIKPGAVEVCDGLDNDCDGAEDEQTCNDDNLCTIDVCDPVQGCIFSYANTACNDGNPCTENDQCSFGLCTGSFIDCDDDNTCTTDGCDPVFGCTHFVGEGPCDDDDPCTSDDTCSQGFCQGTPSGCECNTSADCADMDDGNACNGTLICDKSGVEAKCVIDPSTIADCALPPGANAACMSATCDEDTGQCAIVPINEGQVCNDGDQCTANDTCMAGSCLGSSVDCEDGNPCTTETCDPTTGCQSLYNSAPCDDGKQCTIGDKCNGGACVGGDELPCTDGNACTDDACVEGLGCQHYANSSPCDDGNVCTKDDTCSNKTCVAGSALVCDDNNVCTIDVCNPVQGGCVYTPVAGGCDDGDACTLGDTCSAGACQAGAGLDCNDGNPCTQDACLNGQCSNTPLDGVGCDDGNACTANDTCQAGQCVGSGNAGCCLSNADCDDGNACTQDVCSLVTGSCSHDAAPMNGIACNADSNGCTAGDQCQNGSCTVGAPVDCGGQGDACNDVACVSTGIQSYLCQESPKGEGIPCDDGLFCTTDDACDASGDCVGGAPIDCNEVAGGCLDATCDEANDTCKGVPVADGTACNADSNGCSDGDTCQGGSCVPGALADCSVFADACTDYTCASVDASTYTCVPDPKPDGTPCDDGLYCTSNDACDGTGWCKSGGSDPCSDQANSCNLPSCNELTDSCDFTPKPDGTVCNDGNACTTGDACQSGACAGPDLVCGEFKVSAFHNHNDNETSVVDLGDGRFAIGWTHGKDVYTRTFTSTWSREDTEFSYILPWDQARGVTLLPKDDGFTMIGNAGDQNAGHWCNRRDYTRVYFRNLNEWNSQTQSTDAGGEEWGPDDCNNGFTGWKHVRAARFPSGDFVFGRVEDGNLWVQIRSATLGQGMTQEIGYGQDGYDVGTFGDNRWILVWSEGEEIYGQLWTSGHQHDGVTFQVNSDTSGNQRFPRVATLSGGRFVVIWQSYATGTWQLRAQVFKASGDTLGTEFGIHPSDQDHHTNAVVTYDEDSQNFVVVWEADDAHERGIFGRWFDKNGGALGDVTSLDLKTTGSQKLPAISFLDDPDYLVVAWRGADAHVYARKFDAEWEPQEQVPETTVNTTTEDDQALTAVAALSATSVVAVWTETTDDGDVDVRGRIVDVTTAENGEDFLLSESQDQWQLNPSVSASEEGDFVVAWDSFGQDGDIEGVYYRRFDKDGNALGDEEQANTTTENEQMNPAVAMNPDGSYVIVWESYGQPGGLSYDVVAQCYSKTGNKIGGEVIVNSYTTQSQRVPAVTYVTSPPRYVVTWESYEQDGSSWGIFSQMLNTSCAKLGSEFDVNAHTNLEQRRSQVAADENGRFLVVWESKNQDGDTWGVYGQRFNSDGSKDGSEFKFSYTAGGEQLNPAVTYLGDSGFLLAWDTDGQDESGKSVKFQRYDLEGEKVGLEFVGNITTSGHQTEPQVVQLGADGYGILWNSADQDGDQGSVIGRWFP